MSELEKILDDLSDDKISLLSRGRFEFLLAFIEEKSCYDAPRIKLEFEIAIAATKDELKRRGLSVE